MGFVKSNVLTLATMGGVLVGLVVGIIMSNVKESWTQRQVMYIEFPGTLFLQMLKCVIIPLVIPSLISSVGSMDLGLSRKIGGFAIIYYMCTTMIAVILGIILVVTIRPGGGGLGDNDE